MRNLRDRNDFPVAEGKDADHDDGADARNEHQEGKRSVEAGLGENAPVNKDDEGKERKAEYNAEENGKDAHAGDSVGVCLRWRVLNECES